MSWTTLRFENVDSGEYSRAVNKLVLKIKTIASTVISNQDGELDYVPAMSADPEEDRPGLLDLIEESEATFPKWLAVLEEFQVVASDITSKAEKHIVLFGGAKTTSAKLVRISAFVKDVDQSAERMLELGRSYLEHAQAVNRMVPKVLEELALASNESEKESATEFFDTVLATVEGTRGMANSAVQASGQVETLLETSKKFRPVVRKLSNGFQYITDGQALIDTWEAMVIDILARNEDDQDGAN